MMLKFKKIRRFFKWENFYRYNRLVNIAGTSQDPYHLGAEDEIFLNFNIITLCDVEFAQKKIVDDIDIDSKKLLQFMDNHLKDTYLYLKRSAKMKKIRELLILASDNYYNYLVLLLASLHSSERDRCLCKLCSKTLCI